MTSAVQPGTQWGTQSSKVGASRSLDSFSHFMGSLWGQEP